MESVVPFRAGTMPTDTMAVAEAERAECGGCRSIVGGDQWAYEGTVGAEARLATEHNCGARWVSAHMRSPGYVCSHLGRFGQVVAGIAGTEVADAAAVEAVAEFVGSLGPLVRRPPAGFATRISGAGAQVAVGDPSCVRLTSGPNPTDVFRSIHRCRAEGGLGVKLGPRYRY